ncbi:hypothetical protein [Chelatococcus sp.]|uniref:hypothetical protein n=1 Tax=Chelatococcus sp. TaxID=1953771 RepID=UPI001EC3F92F|nr:hypothetical protein [Chelatococcus sp.]MBX3546881.1 hypothetical protein [Chelatococcus sp.]
MTPAEILQEAVDAYQSAALKRFEKDGRVNRGTGGHHLLVLDGRSPVAKLALASGHGCHSNPGIIFLGRSEVPSQHGEVWNEAGEAACRVFKKHGVRVIKSYAWRD